MFDRTVIKALRPNTFPIAVAIFSNTSFESKKKLKRALKGMD
jgi:hypothetical protein